jgi:hypothetical protein
VTEFGFGKKLASGTDGEEFAEDEGLGRDEARNSAS